MHASYRQLLPHELDAIKAYAAKHGRCWKNALTLDWYRASAPSVLHAIRNDPRNGPGTGWLERFKLPRD